MHGNSVFFEVIPRNLYFLLIDFSFVYFLNLFTNKKTFQKPQN